MSTTLIAFVELGYTASLVVLLSEEFGTMECDRSMAFEVVEAEPEVSKRDKKDTSHWSLRVN